MELLFSLRAFDCERVCRTPFICLFCQFGGNCYSRKKKVIQKKSISLKKWDAFSVYIDSFGLEIWDFVDSAQTESESWFNNVKKVKFLHFFACILDSIMLQSPHVIMGRGDSTIVKNIKNTAAPMVFMCCRINRLEGTKFSLI